MGSWRGGPSPRRIVQLWEVGPEFRLRKADGPCVCGDDLAAEIVDPLVIIVEHTIEVRDAPEIMFAHGSARFLERLVPERDQLDGLPNVDPPLDRKSVV